ncbi:MAG TPA: cytochrome c oxidase accessory protein CcoG [Thiolapillus brandeum]|uniref:Cytochrome c oxidase accessory protein CcoG n=1 Tax=Thiolapillus brandeum TaxID=1076588 RepID=A0A831WB10_9GAMM|nr:cytochrome c oxidase accessory protein CcoG [Thiolapillus brandeum]
MTESATSAENQAKYSDDIYEEAADWHVNTGEEKIYPKQAAGKWRKVKWLTHSIWLLLFIGPFLRWNGQQAILFDIPDRQFHIFGLTILPQDVWMLALVLLFFAMLLAAVTSIAGRVYCGFFCFQTAWTDLFMWLEDKIEGVPAKRRKLDAGPWNGEKIRRKVLKYGIWTLIAVLTGISFVSWFTDSRQLWHDIFTGQASSTAYGVIALFTAGTLVLAGKLREQACFWLCPYARIQGVMYDKETILPTYDFHRGEPRGRLKKGKLVEGNGDCIDCKQCIAVCPTGIDIRMGQQEGCITCSLCMDACDAVMEKIGRPKGLIRYASMDEMEGKKQLPLLKRPRVLIYLTILTLAVSGIIYGITHLGAIEVKVLHGRSPLFVQRSDGTIQNKYDVKILNKTANDIRAKVTASGIEGMQLKGAEETLIAKKGHTGSYIMFINVPAEKIKAERTPIIFKVVNLDNPKQTSSYESMFFAPE